MRGALVAGAVTVYGGTAAAVYFYARSHYLVPASPGAAESAGPHDGGCAYDRIAGRYDSAIGQEEWAMWFPLMRRTLLREARGHVLEVSAGTGRNFEYYQYDKVQSLTLADLSRPMLLEAEDKFYDALRLGHKHPDTRVDFVVCDAHCMVAPEEAKSAAAASPATRSGWWSRSQHPSAPSAAHARSSEDAGSSNSINAGAGADEGRGQQKLKELPGFGSPLNLFRVLMGGSVSTSTSSADNNNAPTTSASGDGRTAAPVPAGLASAGAAIASAGAAQQPPAASPGAGDAGSVPHCACGLPDPSTSGRAYASRCAGGRSEAGLPLTRFPPASFDTVVDTFGLCSHEDPVQVLREMSRVVKPGGKILLLQHGRGEGWLEAWINNRLDAGAAAHAAKWGCWWNRDVLALVHQAGLRIEKLTRWHFGTSYFIIARPA